MRVETKKNLARLAVKFGGSSLSSPQRISRAVDMVKREIDGGTQTAIVVSAMGRTTDDLLETTSAVSLSNGTDQVDEVLSMGERTSGRIFNATLSNRGVRSKYFDPDDDEWPIITDAKFGDSTPILSTCQRRIQRHILSCLEDGIVPVLPGFVGRTKDGRITTMGRGGSDVTAFLLARCLPADECVLVTDSEGLMTADPKLIKNARPLPRIRIGEIFSLADSGTKFLKSKALQYMDDTFRVRITSNMARSLRSGGTLIVGGFPSALTAELESPQPSMMVTITGESLSQNPKIMKEILSKISAQRARILGFSANSNSLIIYLPCQRGRRLVKKIHESVLAHSEMTAMAVRNNLSLIRIVGFGLVETPGLIATVSGPLRKSCLNLYGIFTIASSIVLLVDWEHRQEALRLVQMSLRRVAA